MSAYVPEEFDSDGGRRAPALLHQPRRAGVRPRQPARGRQGGAVRPLQPQPEEPAPAVPRRVPRRPRHLRRPHRRRHRRRPARRGPLREGVRRVRRRLRRPARRRPPRLRAGVERAHQDPRVGPADELPRAEHEVHRLRRPPRRALPLLPRPRRAGQPPRHPVRRRHGPPVRRLQPRARRGHRSRAGHGRAPSRRQRLRVPPGDPGQGARRRARHAARGVAVQRRHLRQRPGVRGAAPAPARPPAARGTRLRRADAARAAQGDPQLPAPCRRRRARRALEQLPGDHPPAHRRARRVARRRRRAGASASP